MGVRSPIGFLKVLLEQIETSGAFEGARRATFLGSAFASFVGDDHASFSEECTDGIPTMLSERELRLLTNLFATWPVSGAVLEIGTYLGGSTSAIARGLLAAEFQDRYYVIDSFGWDDPGFIARLGKDLERLGRQYSLSGRALAEARRGGWLQVYTEVHLVKPYHKMLEIRKALIPFGGGAEHFDLAPHVPTSKKLAAVFVDGFKTWPATAAAMRALQPYLQKGTLLIFQDFSWFNCYWLPILVTCMGDKFRLAMKVDNTAVFEVVSPEISNALDVFGRQPDDNQYAFYRTVLNDYAAAMFQSGDDVGFLQHVSQSYVLSYVMGHEQDAAETKALVKVLSERLYCAWVLDNISRGSFEIVGA